MRSSHYPAYQSELIGQGSEGKVYKTSNPQLIFMASKIYDKDIDQDEKQFLNLLMNTQIKSPMMKIYKHQKLDHQYLVEQQYFEGGNLQKKLYNLQRTDIEQIIQQIGKQLEFIHNNGYVYQDLKPSNIVFGSDPESPSNKLYKICDFGTIRKVNKTEKVFNPENRDGTINYLPFDEYTDYPLDIFSFGALIYELISKQQLFQGANKNEITRAKKQFYENQTQIYEKINQQLKDTKIEFDNMLKKMLDPNPNNRPKIQEVNQFFKSNSIYCDDCKKYQLECLRSKDQIQILTLENQEQKEIIRKYNEKQQKDLNESFSTQVSEDFIQLNDEYVCNIQFAEKIEILNQKLYRSSGRKFKQNGNTGLILLEQQIDNTIKEFLNKVKEDRQVMKDFNDEKSKLNEQLRMKSDQLIIKEDVLMKLNEQLKMKEDQLIMKENQLIRLNEQLRMKEDQLIMKENQLIKLNEQLKMMEDQLIVVKKQQTESMREKYLPQLQMVKGLGLHNQNVINNSRSQKCFPPNLIQNKEVRLYK